MQASSSRWLSLPEHPHALAALIAAFMLLRLVLAATVPLLPQEAYYWQWSLEPDWSYFDHPPLVAWSIAASTALFGQTSFGVKAAAVAWSLGWNLLWARLVLDMFASRALAFWSLLALNLTIVYEAHGSGPTPDTPLIFGWVGVVWAVWRASVTGRARWWLAAGGFAGLALLAKYSAVLLLPVVLLYLVFSPAQRHWLRHPGPYVAVLIAALMFAPVLWWNAQHDWASFAFQGSRRVGQMAAFRPRNALVLLGTQLFMVTPYLLALALVALWRGARDGLRGNLDDDMRLLLFSGAVPVVVFGAISLRSVVKPNWLAPAYWSLIVLGVQQILQRGGRELRVMAIGLASSAVFVVVILGVAVVPDLPLGELNIWSGWDRAAQRVQQEREALRSEGTAAFVFAPNYKTSSLIRFHLPGQPRTYAQDIYGARALQYDYMPLDEELKGATGLLVLSDQRQSRVDLTLIRPWFDSIETVATVETRAFGRVVRRVEILRCTNYRGHPRRHGMQGLSAPAPTDDE